MIKKKTKRVSDRLKKAVNPGTYSTKQKLLVFVFGFAAIGLATLLLTHAAGFVASFEVENGTRSASASVINDSLASGGKAIQFGPGVASTGTRGRAHIVNNTLVSDQNTLLRGGTLWFIREAGGQFSWATGTQSWPVFAQYHLNTVRLAIESGPVSGNNPQAINMTDTITYLDAAVAQATAHHMYAVIDDHWGAGERDMPSAIQFWQTVSARYGNNTNVIFELLNEPVSWYPKDYSNDSTIISDEEQLYNIARSGAPQTPIIMMTFPNPANDDNNSSPTMTDQTNKLTGIDWSNAVVGFHAYNVPNSKGEVQLKQHYPTMSTEFPSPCSPETATEPVPCLDSFQNQSGEIQQTMEAEGISWLCWTCNDLPESQNGNKLANLQNDATIKGYWWPADN